jgi:glutamate-1-semialdehyde 2,1-aminomutase
MFTLFFNPDKVTNLSIATKSDTQRFGSYFRGMLDRGVYLPCSQFEANFISTAHTPEMIDATVAAAREVFSLL